MKRHAKISAKQLFLMLLPLVLATEILSVPAIITSSAHQDAWVSVLLSTVFGLWTVYVLLELSKRYPGLTLVEYSRKILGNWLGTVLMMWVVQYFFVCLAPIGYEVSDFLSLTLLPTTPNLVLIGSVFAVCVYGVYAGIEVIARCSEFIVFFNVLGFVLIFILSIGDMEFSRLLPFLAQGITPVLKGMEVPADWIGELFLIAFLLPHVTDLKQSKKACLWACACIPFIMIVTVLYAQLVLGNLTAHFVFPAFNVVRYISVSDFIERLDPMIASIWIFGVFIKISIFLFAFCLCVSQLFKLNHYRAVLIPITLLVVIGSSAIFQNIADANEFFAYTDPWNALVTQNLIPTLLLIVDTWKRKRNKSKEAPDKIPRRAG